MSRQLTTYLQQRANGVSVDEASASVGMSEIEAKLTEKALAEGHLALPTKGETTMPLDDITTVRIGDGPEIPFSDFKKAAEQVKAANVAGDRIRLIIERVERLEEEKKGIADDVNDVYAEAKSSGYDTKTLKRIVKLRKMDARARQEAEMLLTTYMDAIGMTPIEAAIALAA